MRHGENDGFIAAKVGERGSSRGKDQSLHDPI